MTENDKWPQLSPQFFLSFETIPVTQIGVSCFVVPPLSMRRFELLAVIDASMRIHLKFTKDILKYLVDNSYPMGRIKPDTVDQG